MIHIVHILYLYRLEYTTKKRKKNFFVSFVTNFVVVGAKKRKKLFG